MSDESASLVEGAEDMKKRAKQEPAEPSRPSLERMGSMAKQGKALADEVSGSRRSDSSEEVSLLYGRIDCTEKLKLRDEKRTRRSKKSTKYEWFTLTFSHRRVCGCSLAPSLVESKRAFVAVVFGTRLNLMLAFLPLGVAAHYAPFGGSGLSAALSLLSLCPLAERLGFITEQLSQRTNDTIGALLNVTFGNATELILSIVALQASEMRLIQLSLVGSVLSNTLLVMGSAMVAGGWVHKTQSFQRQPAVTHVVLLSVSSLAFFLPCVVRGRGGEGDHGAAGGDDSRAVLAISRAVSIFLVCAYCLFLFFQLRTHKFMFDDDDADDTGAPKPNDVELQGLVGAPAGGASGQGEPDLERGAIHTDSDESSSDDASSTAEVEEPIALFCGVSWLALVAVLISWISGILVDDIKSGAAAQLHIPPAFLYGIVVPIVGNAAEHASALIFAHRNRMNVAFGIAIGSSVQISLLVIPLLVLISWLMGKGLSLDFQTFQTSVLLGSVALLFVVTQDGRSNWLKGAVLVLAYALLSVAYWFI